MNVIKKYLAHSAKGSHWKKHSYVGIKNGKYIYSDTGVSSEASPEETAINDIASTTGMDTQYARYLNYLAKTKGFDSKEYKEYSSGLAEGDEKVQRAITDTLKRASANRLGGNKTPIKKVGDQNRQAFEDNRDKRLQRASQKTKVSKGKDYVAKMMSKEYIKK